MKKILALLLYLMPLLQAQVEYEYPINNGGAMQDSSGIGTVTTTIFTFNVEESQTVSRIRLRLAASHPVFDELGVSIKSPDGTTVRLFNGIGSDGGFLINTYIADVLFTASALEEIGRPEQGADLGTNLGPWSGTYRPEEEGPSSEYDLGELIGVNSEGTWELIVTDDDAGATGYIYAQDDDTNVIPTAQSRFGTSLGTALFVQFSSPPTLSPIGQWRLSQFSTPADSGHGANGNDFDKDGILNLLEYALGRDPKSGLVGNGLLSLPTYRREAAQNLFVISLDLPSPVPSDLIYKIQASDELSDWDTIAQKNGTSTWSVLEGNLTQVANGSNRQLVELAVNTSGQTHRWLRLLVTEAP